jgi:hypothetical protein
MAARNSSSHAENPHRRAMGAMGDAWRLAGKWGIRRLRVKAATKPAGCRGSQGMACDDPVTIPCGDCEDADTIGLPWIVAGLDDQPLRMQPRRVRISLWLMVVAVSGMQAYGQQSGAAASSSVSEAEVVAEPVPPEVVASAVAAVTKLGEEVVLGRYKVAVDRMNPQWKERTAKQMGGMEKLEKQLDGVAAQMVQQGISMISFKPQGQPLVHQVAPGRKVVRENGVDVEKLVHTKWMVLVPTATRFRIMRKVDGQPARSHIIESAGFQVAVSDKGANDWTFIDGSRLSVSDLRGLFGTLPQDMELPQVSKKEVR